MDREPIPERLVVETDSLAVRRARPVSGVLGLGAFASFLFPLVVMMVGGGVFGMDKPASWGAIVSTSWIGGMIVAALAGATRASEMARAGRVEVAEGALTLVRGSKRESCPAGSVLGGSVTPRTGGALLMLSLADGRVASAVVPSPAAGERVLEALQVDPMGRALVGRFQGGLARSFAGFGVAFALVLLGGWLKNAVRLSPATGLAWTAISLALVGGWLLRTRQPEIAVGADGVRIRGRVGVRFIALDRIAAVKVDTFGVLVLELVDGTAVRTRVALGNGPMLAAVAHRIELAKRSGVLGTGAPLGAQLARGARTVAAWRDALRSKVKTAGYRHASIEGGELEQLVGAPGTSAEQRIGAALALAEAGGDEGRARVRIAAAQCVDPRVRVALETIATEAEAEAEERAIEDALAVRTANAH